MSIALLIRKAGIKTEAAIGRTLISSRRVNLREKPPKKILVATFNGIGDALVALPAIRELRRAFPQAEIYTLSKGRNIHLLQYFTDEFAFSARSIPPSSSKAKQMADWMLLALGLRKMEFDLSINFEQDWMDWIFLLVRAKQRVTVNYLDGEHASLAHQTFELNPHNLRTLEYLRVLEAIGCPIASCDGIQFNIPEQEESIARQILENKWEMAAPTIGLYITSGPFMPQRNWSKEKAEAFVEQAMERGFRVIIFGKPEDLCGKNGQEILYADGQYSLGTVAALMKKCSVFVGVDGGLTHLASAVNTPVVALFGPTAACHFGPLNSRSRILVDSTKSCAPCHNGRIDDRKAACAKSPERPISCVQLEPELVLREAEELIAQ